MNNILIHIPYFQHCCGQGKMQIMKHGQFQFKQYGVYLFPTDQPKTQAKGFASLLPFLFSIHHLSHLLATCSPAKVQVDLFFFIFFYCFVKCLLSPLLFSWACWAWESGCLKAQFGVSCAFILADLGAQKHFNSHLIYPINPVIPAQLPAFSLTVIISYILFALIQLSSLVTSLCYQPPSMQNSVESNSRQKERHSCSIWSGQF